MLARVKLKGIDGGPHKRWSMWFNSKQRAEPYQPLTWSRPVQRSAFPAIGVAHRCCMAVVSSCREMLGEVAQRGNPSPPVASIWLGTLEELPVTSRRKVGMTSSPHGPYGLGYTRATMAMTMGSQVARPSRSQKVVSVQIAACNSAA